MTTTTAITWRELSFEASDRQVYAPRPASLLLAAKAVERVRPGERFLDACTGSGVVGIAVARYVAGAEVSVADVNPSALEAAHRNADANGVAIQVIFSDLYKAFPNDGFDVISVHPPAVPYPPGATWGLSEGMTLATDGGSDGSELVIRSIVEARSHLRPGGRLLLLLPHWSNVALARRTLEEHYVQVQELARLEVEFFPARDGVVDEPLLEHVRQLASNGTIEMTFETEVPLSVVSVIEATRPLEPQG
ncbi:methyltransferase [Cyanobium sp. FGCU-6]|nr:methyltransferase [Cyanobium sp. FGCU6]